MELTSYNTNYIIQDPSNNPSVVTIFDPNNSNDAGFTFPFDVQISIDGEKIIAESQILDGEVVFERISTKPRDINFDFTFREKGDIQAGGTLGIAGVRTYTGYIFPQEALNKLYSYWKKDSILNITNTLLNGQEIFDIVCLSHNIQTIRGNTNVTYRLSAKEAVEYLDGQGQTLIQNG